MLNREIARLVSYGIVTGLIPEEERIYSRNLLLDLYHEDSYEEPEAEGVTADDLEDILKELLDEAVRRGLLPEDSVTYRDLWDTRLMNCLVPRPKEVIRTFLEYEKENPKKATDYFYKLSQDSDYIRRYRVKKDLRWKVTAPTGRWISPSICPSRRRIQRRLRRRGARWILPIRSASCARKPWDTPEE